MIYYQQHWIICQIAREITWHDKRALGQLVIRVSVVFALQHKSHYVKWKTICNKPSVSEGWAVYKHTYYPVKCNETRVVHSSQEHKDKLKSWHFVLSNTELWGKAKGLLLEILQTYPKVMVLAKGNHVSWMYYVVCSWNVLLTIDKAHKGSENSWLSHKIAGEFPGLWIKYIQYGLTMSILHYNLPFGR